MLFEVIVLILSLPTGFLISGMARDELIIGRKWFVCLMVISAIVGMVFFVLQNITIVWACGFIFLVSLISYRKSFDKKWTKIR